MNKKFGFVMIMIAITVSLVFIVGDVNKACAQIDQGKGQNKPDMAARLDLTKEQKANITAKEDAMDKELSPLKNAIRDNRDKLNTELSSDKPDQAKVNALIDNISKDMTDIQKKKTSFMIWMRQQLTPDQKQKLLTLINSRQNENASEESSGN